MKDAIRIPTSSSRWQNLWEVQSESRPNVSYVVAQDSHGRWACSCPRWIFHTPRQDCKHVRQVQGQLAGSAPVRTYTQAEVEAKPAIQKEISRFSLIEID